MASFAGRGSWPALYSCSGGTACQDVDSFVETVKATAAVEYDESSSIQNQGAGMADLKITDLSLAASVASTDLVVVVADPSGTPTTKKSPTSLLPVSTAMQTALNLKANLASPTFTGIVTTAGQIVFPSTVNLSSGANTLDDYEEGTWTPSFSASSPPSVSFAASRYGVYVKIGKTVFISGTASLISTSGGSGNLQITGLPFTAASDTTGGHGALALGLRSGWTTTTPETAYVQASASYIQLYNDTASAAITAANLSNSSLIQFSGFYITTS